MTPAQQQTQWGWTPAQIAAHAAQRQHLAALAQRQHAQRVAAALDSLRGK